MSEASAWLAWTLRHLPPLILLWLAFFFGRTLRAGRTPLIERIARRSNPTMPEALCRYTRRLTAVWCIYFVAAATLAASAGLSYRSLSIAVWSGTLVLFVGEHLIRPRLFPGEVFPGLVRQIRDTWSVWRPHR